MSVFESLLNNTFTISRRDRISDGQGGWAIVYAALDNVQGRIRPASSAERDMAKKEQRDITHVLYVVHGTDIAREDRVECGDLIVDVQGIREPSKFGHHLEIDCLEVQHEATVGEMGS
jgi:SPP1 family predicted phage head-tail adaptor